MTNEFDVIVVGGGGSGLAAALAAAEAGGKVLILEKEPQTGGTTGIAIGSFTAAGTELQKAADIEDDPAAHAEDVKLFAPPVLEARNNEELRNFFLGETAATYDWLRGLGLAFVGPNPEPPNRVPRMHNVVPGGKAYIAALQLAAIRAGALLVCSARARKLVRDSERVVGVVCDVNGAKTEYRARRGVILAAGDYANNSELISQYRGPEFAHIDGINPNATGDGQIMAKECGAKLENLDVTYGPELRFVAASKRPFQQWLPSRGISLKVMNLVAPRIPQVLRAMLIKRLLVTWQHPETSLFDDGAILINQDGRRFVNETEPTVREIGVANQPDKKAYILLDGRLVARYSAWPNFISTAPDIAYAYVRDYQRLRRDVTVTGYNLEDVALRRGINGEHLAQAVAEFNEYVGGKHPDPLGRANDSNPLQSDPWVLLGPVKAYFTTTEGGALVNQSLQVLDENHQMIPGLYAVGQNGLGGMILWGHGLHIAWALTSGRLAGRAVMMP